MVQLLIFIKMEQLLKVVHQEQQTLQITLLELCIIEMIIVGVLEDGWIY